MKRLVFAAVLAAAMAVPSAALSSSEGTATSVDRSSVKRDFQNFNFTVYLRDGKPVKVGRFKYKNADAECTDGGPLSLSGQGFGTERRGSNGKANVNDGKFSKTYPAESQGGGEGTFRVVGSFRDHNNRIVGYFRAKGDFPKSGASDCDTGKERYDAGEAGN